MLKYLLSTFPLLLLSLGLGVSAYGICEQTIDSLLEVLESDPSVQQQVRHNSLISFHMSLQVKTFS